MIKRSPTIRLRALARFTAALLAAAALAACAAGKEGRSGPSMMVAAADPAAAEAGLEILRAGGSALDAAIATQLVLGLVEPQSSGIGGGGFLLHYDHDSGRVESYDGRETAPRAVGPDLFLTPSGEPMPFREAMVGGRAVGVPGLLRMLELAHREHGRLEWSALFEPAIRLAEQGFAVSPYLAREIAEAHSLDTYPATAAYFLDAAGQPKAPGTVIVNEAYADTLRAIAIGGADAFYGGPIAQDIVAAVQNDPVNPGLLAAEDFARYEAKRRDPVCGPYRIFVLCSMGPPSSGGVAVLEMLGLLERFHMPARLPLSPETAHLFAEAMRLAFADRDRYLADPDYVAVPAAGLLNSAYLAERAALIQLTARVVEAEPGRPPGIQRYWLEERAWREPGSTTHLSVVDEDGNAVALTSSIEQNFGSRLMVRGFLLNQQLTDFSFEPERDGVPIANRVEPGKRPRSSMAPTFVFDRAGNLRFAVGSPGGPFIIPYVAQALLGVLAWDLDLQSAVALPHIAAYKGKVYFEAGTPLERLVPALEALGHEVELIPFSSGLHGIAATPWGLEGAADPRKPGVALGD